MTINHIPLSLYIHIPWCIQKCPYCDFNSHTLTTSATEQESQYIQRLIQDFKLDIDKFEEKREIHSIFIGGGTPSLFSASSIDKLLTEIEKISHFSENIEITIEANPGAVDASNFKAYKSIGINRISIGVQSFNNQHLQSLGRIHNNNEAERAVKIAQDSGFDNINIDLMFGLPKQTVEQAVTDVEQGVRLNTEHLSYYQLTIEPNTEFAISRPPMPNTDEIMAITDETYPILTEQGFQRYEVSAWTSGRASKHNMNYWQYGDYLGIGAGAHGKITTINTDGLLQIHRTIKSKHPNTYLSKDILQNTRIVLDSEKIFEFMLNALRLKNGFNRQLILERGLFSDKRIMPLINELTALELLNVNDKVICPTKKGYLFLDEILEQFL